MLITLARYRGYVNTYDNLFYGYIVLAFIHSVLYTHM